MTKSYLWCFLYGKGLNNSLWIYADSVRKYDKYGTPPNHAAKMKYTEAK